MSASRSAGAWSMDRSGDGTGSSDRPAAFRSWLRRMTKLNRFRSWTRNSSSRTSVMQPGRSGLVATSTGAFLAMNSSTCEPKWKWRRINQFASGRIKFSMPQASSRCRVPEKATLRGVKTLMTWISTIIVRANGRTNGSTYCRERELESASQARLTSSSIGVLWSRYIANQGLGSRGSCVWSRKSGACFIVGIASRGDVFELHQVKIGDAAGGRDNRFHAPTIDIVFQRDFNRTQPPKEVVFIVGAVVLEEPERVGRQVQAGFHQRQQGGDDALTGAFDDVDRAQQADRVGLGRERMQIAVEGFAAWIAAQGIDIRRRAARPLIVAEQDHE